MIDLVTKQEIAAQQQKTIRFLDPLFQLPTVARIVEETEYVSTSGGLGQLKIHVLTRFKLYLEDWSGESVGNIVKQLGNMWVDWKVIPESGYIVFSKMAE